MKEPDQAEIMRTVKRGGSYKKHPGDESDKVNLSGPPESKENKEEKPEQIVHPIQSKPEVVYFFIYFCFKSFQLEGERI